VLELGGHRHHVERVGQDARLPGEVRVAELLPDFGGRLHEQLVELPEEVRLAETPLEARSERVDLGLRRHGDLLPPVEG
jgi:hypothetical protein